MPRSITRIVFSGLATIAILLSTPLSVLAADYSNPANVHVYTTPTGPGVCAVVITWDGVGADAYTFYSDNVNYIYGGGVPKSANGEYTFFVNGQGGVGFNFGINQQHPIPAFVSLYSYYNSLYPVNEGNYGTGVTIPIDQSCPYTFPGSATPHMSLNAGGSTVGGFAADSGFAGGTPYSTTNTVDTSTVINTTPAAIYQTARYGNMSYTLPNLTPHATYTLRLHFNELYFGVGNNGGGVNSRVFSATANGRAVLLNYDVFAAAGGANKAVTEQMPVIADANGNVTIQFSPVTNHPIISGIQLYNGMLPSQAPNLVHQFSSVINAGGGAAGDFVADANFTGGTSYNTTAPVDVAGVTNPAPQSVYQSVRYGTNFSYDVPLLEPEVDYVVRLHFNELYFTSSGSRVFDVSINGTQVLSNFDVYAAAGAANKAIVEEFTIPTDVNGNLNIQFMSTINNAMVSGIEVELAQ